MLEKGETLGYDFAPLPKSRIRKKKKMPGEECEDEPIVDPLQKFKVDTYYRSIDVISQELRDRFNPESVSVFKDLSLFTKRRIEEIAASPNSLPKDAFDGFCEAYGHLVGKDDLRREYMQFCKVFSSFEKVETGVPVSGCLPAGRRCPGAVSVARSGGRRATDG